jgi:Tol biopolymer transport system component
MIHQCAVRIGLSLRATHYVKRRAMSSYKRLFLLLLINTLVLGLTLIRQEPLASQPHQATAEERLALFEARVIVPENGGETAVLPPTSEFPTRSSNLHTVSGTIAYQSNRADTADTFDIYQQLAAGGEDAQALITSDKNDVTPVWSSDGSQLLFASDRSGSYDIYLRTADGQEINLTQHPADDVHPAWSPDGQQIIFSSERGGGYFQIYTMNPDGGNVQQVGVVPGNNAMYPRLSPDGQQIAYMRATTTAPLCEWDWDVWVMDADGSNQQRVTTALGADLYPQWSPDGSEIIYGSCRNFFYFNLYAYNTTTGAERQVTNWFFYNEWGATYSPDGQYIAFNSAPTGSTADIYIMAAQGGEAGNLTRHSADDWNPTWNDYSPPLDCAGATASPPVLLITGWGGSASNLRFDGQLKYLEGWFGQHGYVYGCNLFYASDTSPHKYLAQHAEIIWDNLCQQYEGLEQHYAELGQSWQGLFALVGYSYGGLRARAFLESGWYDLPCNENPGQPLIVNNLITLGTPHGGEAGNLPFATMIGLLALLDGQWPAIEEMLPWVRLTQNMAQSQNEETCYHIVAGDGRLQAGILPSLLLPIYYKWPTVQALPNDFAVHQLSSFSLLLLPDLYPQLSLIANDDLHGQVPHLIDPLGLLQSYINPADTFTEYIFPRLQATDCPLLPLGENLAADIATDRSITALIDEQRRPQITSMPPMRDITADTLNEFQTHSGDFSLTSPDPTQIMLYWNRGDVAFTLTNPQGNILDPLSAAGDPNVDYLTLDTGFGLMASYQITDTLTGDWSYTISAGELEETAVYRLLTILSEPIAIHGSAPGWSGYNLPVVITATVTHDNTPLPGGSVTVQIKRPDGAIYVLPMHDDGQHGDGEAGDSVYGAMFTQTDAGGIYGFSFTVAGVYNGVPYVRSGATFLTVAPGNAQLNHQYTDRGVDAQGNSLYDWLAVDIGLRVTKASTYTVSAELYAGPTFIAQARTQLYLTPGEKTAVLHFAGDKIRAAGLDGPYQVRHLLLLDEATVTLLVETADNIHTTAPYNHRQFGQGLLLYLPVIIR